MANIAASVNLHGPAYVRGFHLKASLYRVGGETMFTNLIFSVRGYLLANFFRDRAIHKKSPIKSVGLLTGHEMHNLTVKTNAWD